MGIYFAYPPSHFNFTRAREWESFACRMTDKMWKGTNCRPRSSKVLGEHWRSFLWTGTANIAQSSQQSVMAKLKVFSLPPLLRLPHSLLYNWTCIFFKMLYFFIFSLPSSLTMIPMAHILLTYIKFTNIVLAFHVLRTPPLIENKQKKLKLLKKISQHFLALYNFRFKSKLSLVGSRFFETHIWPTILGFTA